MPKGIYPRTEYHKKIISESHKGLKFPNRKKPEPFSEEHKKKMREIAKQRGFGKWMKGKKMPDEIKEKIRETLKGKKPKNFQLFFSKRFSNKGRKFPEEWRRKISEGHKGEKCNFWKGGISLKKGYRPFMTRRRKIMKQNAEGSHTLEQWEELKKKFNYMCLCCKKEEPEITLTEDHIIPLTKGGTNYIDNIQPLCNECNARKYVKIIDFRLWFDKSKAEALMKNNKGRLTNQPIK